MAPQAPQISLGSGGDMGALAGVVILEFAAATAAAFAVGYYGSGKRIWVGGATAVAAPFALNAWFKYRTRQRGAHLRTCIDSYCGANPTHCKKGDDGVWYINDQYMSVFEACAR